MKYVRPIKYSYKAITIATYIKEEFQQWNFQFSPCRRRKMKYAHRLENIRCHSSLFITSFSFFISRYLFDRTGERWGRFLYFFYSIRFLHETLKGLSYSNKAVNRRVSRHLSPITATVRNQRARKIIGKALRFYWRPLNSKI